ncbi:MAG: hypothetical protein E7360_04895 [Clostridiales bacterium]|nr:hypothetical protein [Clostridiales bacterium]
MRAKNALKIAVSNYALVFKNLLYKVIMFVIFSFTLSLILRIRLQPFFDVIRPVFKDFGSIITSVLSDVDYASAAAALSADFNAVITFLSNNIGNIVLTVVIIAVVFIFYRFLTGISDCTLMILVNGYMTDMSHRGYIGTLVENLKKILVYQLIDGVCSIIHCAIVGLIIWGVFKLTILIMPLSALFLTTLIVVLAISIYCTVMSQVMSNILLGDCKSVKKAFLTGLTPKREYFGKMFAAYLTVVVILLYFHITATVFTFGVGELLLIPFGSLVIVCMKVVDYFTINKKKYFLDYDHIVVPKELRENDEKLLSDVEI